MAKPDQGVVTVRARFPEAQAVFIMGDFNNWSTAATPMMSTGRGQWEVQLHSALRPVPACFFVWEQGQSFGRLVRQPVDVSESSELPLARQAV